MPKELPVVYTKLRIAEIQMDRAIAVLLDDNDLVCAITLAGAAEEIFGNLLAANGESGWMTDVITDTVNMGKSLGHQWKFGDIKWEANWFRNELKHMTFLEHWTNYQYPLKLRWRSLAARSKTIAD
ncbi:hypothetical protein FVQ98_16625 [Ottowia sp. GY511]|uniref:Uncharacterized protein n=1 Tax=Ottowia flava TaxID=2675430 RepID=A0ABW4KRS1_9BURK|nr:hypothetical protein [Ottowia sp. GY511]TXK23552.1 hypothetical protein FVQ98_16625 [Ottowia sp. GY511]